MGRDKALGIAVAAGIAYAIVVVSVSTTPTALSMSANRPVAIHATFAATGQTLRLSEPAFIDAITQWLDDAVNNPVSPQEAKLLPSPVNELNIDFESGQRSTIYFSGRTMSDAESEARLRHRHRNPIYLVKHDEACFTIDGVPDIIAGYMEISELPPVVHKYPRTYSVKPPRQPDPARR